MIRVRIGTDGDIHSDAEKVVEYSIKRNASDPENVDIQFIRPGYKNGVTGFTNHRFLIPELCNYEGYAIYMDVDMLVLGDIAELWEYRQPGKWVTTKQRDDVSVIDCSAFKDLPKLADMKANGNNRNKFHKNTIRNQIGNRHIEAIPNEWNTCDECFENTKLIHYTDLNTQPWKPCKELNYNDHPCFDAESLFFSYLENANQNTT